MSKILTPLALVLAIKHPRRRGLLMVVLGLVWMGVGIAIFVVVRHSWSWMPFEIIGLPTVGGYMVYAAGAYQAITGGTEAKGSSLGRIALLLVVSLAGIGVLVWAALALGVIDQTP